MAVGGFYNITLLLIRRFKHESQDIVDFSASGTSYTS